MRGRKTQEHNSVITVEGMPFEIGYQHGEKAKQLVRENVKYYFYLWETYGGLDRVFVKEKAKQFISPIEKYSPELFEEMRGIAAGAAVDLDEIVALNARYEFVWAQMAFTAPAQGGCTSIFASSGKKAYIAQNWDYKPRLRNGCILLRILPNDRPLVLTHTEAGILGEKGLNSLGLGVCINALVSDQDTFEAGVPFLVITRKILDSATFSEAIDATLRAKTFVSGNILIAHAEGECLDIEITPTERGFLYPKDRFMVHTNHFLDQRLKSKIVDKFIPIVPDTLVRIGRAERLIKGKEADPQSLKTVFQDHFNWPDSICRHPNANFEEDMQLITCSSLVMDLSQSSMEIAFGPPCENKYQKFSLK